MLLEVVTKLSGYTEPYLFKVNQFHSIPKKTLVLEGNWSFVDGDFDKFKSDADLMLNSECNLVIDCKMFNSSTAHECKYCGSIVDDGSSLCYSCKDNNDTMYYMVREGLVYYKYDKEDG